ncbi:DDE 3 domain containing protein [Asbolus verrucosus]|uniref:DDE 3 domain containing protein n=1 Tax=Asbolus verrucosus TaxID=1661398 RepID=A0A482W9U3_ASBVE|nr:DDE 3 domain containing protein [Asbolus verrucosus]
MNGHQIIFSDESQYYLWARLHSTAITSEFLISAQVNVFPWPSHSPELSLIEHVWKIIGVEMGNLRRPSKNLVELRRRIQEPYDHISQPEIDNLIPSIPRMLLNV